MHLYSGLSYGANKENCTTSDGLELQISSFKGFLSFLVGEMIQLPTKAPKKINIRRFFLNNK
jgi:hypothetical protein